MDIANLARNKEALTSSTIQEVTEQPIIPRSLKSLEKVSIL